MRTDRHSCSATAGARRVGRTVAVVLLTVLTYAVAAQATPFCDCCCNAAAGTGGICAGCDLNANGSVTLDELTLLGCATNPICLAFFPTPGATPTQRSACIGDCSGDDRVTINELLIMVNIALSLAPVGNCTPGDVNHDGMITINELLSAVVRALSGCTMGTPVATPTFTEATTPASATASPSVTPRVPTATPTSASSTVTSTRTPLFTATSTVTVATLATATATRSPSATASRSPSLTVTHTAPATATPSRTASPSATAAATSTPCAAVARSAAGGAVIIANAMGVIPSVVASIVSGVRFGTSIAPGGGAGMCPRGGTASRTGSIPGTMTITLTDCRLATADGLLEVDGTVTLNGLLVLTLNANLQFANKDGTGTTTRLTSSATLMGTVTPQLGGSCFLTSANLQLSSGTLESHVPDDAGTSVTFSNTAVAMSVATFTSDCVPSNYTLTFNGPATLALTAKAIAPPGATSIPVTFNAFTVGQNATTMPAQTTMNGTVTAACFGGAVNVTTRAAVTQAIGVLCPTGGALRVTAGTAADVLYLPGSAVGIDTNLDGVSEETFPSCVDPQLTTCQTQCGPGSTPTRTLNVTNTAAGTGTATRTATPTTPNGAPSPSATPTRTAIPTPTVTGAVTVTTFCDSLSLPASIPDANATGISNSITIADNTVIGDLNVRLIITHSYVGDLRVRLTHVNTGTTTRLLESAPPPSCGENDVDAWFDDEAGRVAANECPSSPPAIDGSVKPLDALSGFDGQQIAGTWRLDVADLNEQDTGSLVGWCLIVNSPAPVVTGFTCEGDPECTVFVGDPFGLSFSFFDPNGNASSWRITGTRDDNFMFDVGSDFIAPSSGSGTIGVNVNPFTCDAGNCTETEFDYRVIVTDTTGLDSPPLRVHITVPATGP